MVECLREKLAKSPGNPAKYEAGFISAIHLTSNVRQGAPDDLSGEGYQEIGMGTVLRETGNPDAWSYVKVSRGDIVRL